MNDGKEEEKTTRVSSVICSGFAYLATRASPVACQYLTQSQQLGDAYT